MLTEPEVREKDDEGAEPATDDDAPPAVAPVRSADPALAVASPMADLPVEREDAAERSGLTV